MTFNKRYFHNILADLIDENPVACQAILSILEVVFTTDVPTLAVTLTTPPRLLVNLEFLREHAQTEEDVKAVLLHEFIHVLLNHTEKFKVMDHALNIALDAVINNIVQRTCGEAYGDFFRRYYADAKGAVKLLRPLDEEEYWYAPYPDKCSRQPPSSIDEIRVALYDGRLLADDILDLVKHNAKRQLVLSLPPGRHVIGGHHPQPRPEQLPGEARQALEKTMKRLNGDGIFRSPKDRGIGADAFEAVFTAKPQRLIRWEKAAWEVLRACVTPDRRSGFHEIEERSTSLPVLNESDRRAFVRSLWNPLIPDVSWAFQEQKPKGTCQVYLDVSGSMNAELGALVGLLNNLGRFIRRPFWAFSDEVSPAVIENGRLKTSTTGGTSMNCVLEHVVKTAPGKAVVITDGYIERCKPDLLRQLRASGQQIFAIVSRLGNTSELRRAGIPARQLVPFPEDLS